MEDIVRQELKNYYGNLDPDFQKWLGAQIELTEKDILADANLNPQQKTSLLECNREHLRILQEQQGV